MKKPKQPQRMNKLYDEIMKHPNYMNATEGMKFAFERGCVCEGSLCVKENNKWARDIWNYLYLGKETAYVNAKDFPEPEMTSTTQ